MQFLPRHPVRLQPYFGYRSRDRLVIAARALRSAPPAFERGGRFHAMRTMLRQFASREQPGLAVKLELRSPTGETIRHEAVTDEEGFIRFEIALEPAWELPEHTVWETTAFHWTNREDAQQIAGHILVPGTHEGIGIISDIDDTIIETGITGGLRSVAKNWRRVVAQLPAERVAVPGSGKFYGRLGGGLVRADSEDEPGAQVDAMHRPFFYVSSSPWNLYSYLIAYLKSRDLPLGPLLLRDWGFDRATLGRSSHGAHKSGTIDTILATYPDMRFALIGDDTQGDLPAYAEVVKHNPDRIAAVFIRKAGEPMTPEELTGKASIEAAGVPLWLGDSYEIGQDFLRSAGLAHDRDAEQIVDVVEQAGRSK